MRFILCAGHGDPTDCRTVMIIVLSRTYEVDHFVSQNGQILDVSYHNLILGTFGTSLEVQWLRFHAPNAGGTGSIPDWGRSHLPHGMARKNTWDNPVQLGDTEAATIWSDKL